jgi:beta-lactamase superfamily II metal-dependent hydrolase
MKGATAMARQAISVRTYDVGFGDMHLVQIPGADDRPRRILIDCGVHARGKLDHRPMKAIVGRLLHDVTEPGGVPTIDVVVATHRHADHISGFADDRWSHVRVGTVLMPWTEDPDDPDALRLAARRDALARGLKEAVGARNKPTRALAEEMLEDVLGASNAASVRMLQEGFSPLPGKRAVRRRYLSSRSRPLAIDGADGARVHVLGPARSEGALSELEPPAEQRYLALGRDEAEKEGPLEPFDERFQCDASKMADMELSHLLPQADRDDIAELLEDPEGLAAQQQAASNDSSLLLVLEMGRAVLVFAGDAEWRSWRAVLADSEARALLGRASFLKLGHHGSYNATPRELVEDVLPGKRLWAVVSTLGGRPFPSIPHERLLAEMRRRDVRVVRSDGVDLPPDVGPPALVVGEDGSFYEVKIPI